MKDVRGDQAAVAPGQAERGPAEIRLLVPQLSPAPPPPLMQRPPAVSASKVVLDSTAPRTRATRRPLPSLQHPPAPNTASGPRHGRRPTSPHPPPSSPKKQMSTRQKKEAATARLGGSGRRAHHRRKRWRARMASAVRQRVWGEEKSVAAPPPPRTHCDNKHQHPPSG